jgi:hypothetical protein
LNGDPNRPAAGEGASAPETALESAPAGQPNLQSVLVACLVGAIILMIAIAAFWTSL